MSKLVIGDVHLNKNAVGVFSKVLYPFLKQLNLSYEIDSVVFLGDIFTSSKIDNDSLKLFKELMLIYKDVNDIKILVGNHDLITKSENIYELLLLRDNIKIYNELTFENNNIYIPYIFNSIDYSMLFSSVKDYINKTTYKNYYLYSHNDFSEIYKFRSAFFNITPFFKNVGRVINLINGHNHVPFFKNVKKFNILNIGSAVNLNYNDSYDNNNFLLIKNDEIKILQNKYSIKYHTFHVWKDADIYHNLTKLNVDNYYYVKFIIHDPSVVIDSNFKEELYNSYSIGDVQIEYELNSLLKLAKKHDITDSTLSIDNICDKFNISLDEFIDTDNSEKMEVLITLLMIMFENRNTSPIDVDTVINSVKRYLI
jgi:predicted phosphodiesterase